LLSTRRELPTPPAPALDVPDGLPRGIDLGRIVNAEAALDRFGAELVYSMTDQCLLADEPAYRAFQGFRDKTQNSGWRMFEQALEHGIDTLDDPAPSLVDLFAHLDRVPDWVDFDQLHRGAVAYWRAGPLVPMVLAYSVIGVGFTDYAASRPVLFSGRMLNRDQIGQRLLESFRYIARAYTPGGMVRSAEGFKHTARVRMIHATVRHTLSRSPDWDWADWGIPINNFDGMDTQAGKFGVEVVDSLARSGVRFSARELEDIFALTRYVGYVIGVPEEILHTDEEDARRKHELHKLLEPSGDEGNRRIVRGIIDFSCEESLGGYDVLPPWLGKVMTVERRKKLSYGLLCAWQPRQITEQVGVQPDAWRFVLPAARPFIRLADLWGRRHPERDAARTAKVLAEFDKAIAMREGEEHALAEPEALAVDVAAGGATVRRSYMGQRKDQPGRP
jgi:hypothetical protein